MVLFDKKSPQLAQQAIIFTLYDDIIDPIRYNGQELHAESFLENERNRMKFLVQDVDDSIMILAVALDNLKNTTRQNAESGAVPPVKIGKSDSILNESVDIDCPEDCSNPSIDISAKPSPIPATNPPASAPNVDPVPSTPPKARLPALPQAPRSCPTTTRESKHEFLFFDVKS